jgi:hypothetical protein
LVTPGGRDMESKSRLAHPTGTRHRNECDIFAEQDFTYRGEFALPADERGPWQRQWLIVGSL